VAWLERVRAASLAAGREDEWRQYLAAVLARRGRKYALVSQLQRLRA
jgi:hypothetical protein